MDVDSSSEELKDIFRGDSTAFDKIYDAAPVGLGYLNRDLRYVRVNNMLARMNGKSVADHIGRTVEAVLPWLAPKIEAICRQVLQTGEPVMGVELQGRDRGEAGCHYYLAYYFALRDVHGAVQGISVMALDITERKRSEQELRKAELRYRTVADFTYDWEYWQRPDGKLEYVSPSCERITGYAAEEFVRNPGLLDDLVVADDREAWLQHRRDGERENNAAEVRFRIRRRDGETCWIEHNCRSVTDDTGRFLGYRVSNRDVTRRVQAEMDVDALRGELSRMLRATTTGHLTGAIAHEINQPLAAIMNNAQAALRFLSRDEPDLEEVGAALKEIVDDDWRATEVIARLRRLLKEGELERAPVNVNETLREVVKLFRHQAMAQGVSVRLALDEDLPLALGDRVQLQQVVLNLMGNAFHAVQDRPDGGRGIVIATASSDTGAIEVSVEDSGGVIAEEAFSRLFEPFYTTRPDGLGMGLHICRSIIDLLGGEIRARRNDNPGLTVHFTLPRANGERAS